MSEIVPWRAPERAAIKAEAKLMRLQLSASVEQTRAQIAAHVEQTRIQAAEAVEVARYAVKITAASELGKTAVVALCSLDNSVSEGTTDKPGLELHLRGMEEDIINGTRNMVRSYMRPFL